MHSRVQFRETGDLKALAQGTCLSDRSDILEHKNGQFTQGFSDLVRIVVCVLFLLYANVIGVTRSHVWVCSMPGHALLGLC